MSNEEKLQWFYDQTLSMKNDLFYFAYSILRSIPESEDAVSNAIIKAHTNINHLRNIQSLKPWLFRIVRNECYSIANSLRRTVPIDEDIALHLEPGSELKIDVEKALNQLPIEQREAITLYYVCGHSINEIAKISHVPSGTIKSRLSRARTALKKFLGDDYYGA